MTQRVTGDLKGATGDAKGATGDAKGDAGDASIKGDTGDAKGDAGDVKGATGDAKGATGDAKGDAGDVKGATGDAKGDASIKGDTGDRKGDTGDRKGDTGDRKGDTGDAKGAVKGDMGDAKGDAGDAKGRHSYVTPTIIEPSLTIIEPSLGGADASRFQDAPETFGQPATGPLKAENVTKAINAPPRRPVNQHDPLSVSPEFVARMRERYPGLDVEAEIDTALNHTAVLKALDVEKYVGNWLRRTNGWVKETRAASARSPATNGVGQDGDPMEKYHRLAKELGQEGG